jgi:hypothetical protein
VTSEGRVQAGQVRIAPKPNAAAGPVAEERLAGVTSRITAGVEQRLVLPSPFAQADVPALKLSSSRDIALKEELKSSTQFDADRRTVLFTVPRSSVSKLKSGDPLTVQLQLARTDGSVELRPLMPDAVFYADDADLAANATVKRTSGKRGISVDIKLPNGATKAFTSLSGERLKATGKITLKNGRQQAVTGECPIRINLTDRTDTRQSCQLMLVPSDAAFGQALGQEAANDAKVELAFTGPDVPRLKAATLPIP